MKRIIPVLLFVFLFSLVTFAQSSYVTIITDFAIIKGTPAATGITMASADQGDVCEYFGMRGEWYLIQTAKYVGWIHKSTATIPSKKESGDFPPPPPPPVRPIPQRLPDDTPLSSGTSVFTKEYTGTDRAPTILVKNSTDRVLTLVFGGVKYELQASQELTLNVVAGVYGYTASAPRVQSITGVSRYENGHRYSWEFYIKTVRY